MTPPRVSLLQKPTYKLATSNYFDGELESFNTARISSNTSWGGTISADVGADINIKQGENGIETTVEPGVELKYKQTFGKATIFDTPVSFGGYARYQHIGEKNKGRVTVFASTPINDKVTASVYAHCTTGFEEGANKVGGWASLECKLSDRTTIWWDVVQVNKTIGGGYSVMTNGGLTISLF